MRRYETIFILRPSLAEKEITDVIDNTLKIINDDGGTVIELDKWGMRKLAYLIKKEKQGYYVFCDYAALPQSVAEMERKFRIDDSVLKYMTVKITASITEEEITAVKGAIEEKKVAAQKAVEDAEKAASAESTEKAAPEKKASPENKSEEKKEEKKEEQKEEVKEETEQKTGEEKEK